MLQNLPMASNAMFAGGNRVNAFWSRANCIVQPVTSKSATTIYCALRPLRILLQSFSFGGQTPHQLLHSPRDEDWIFLLWCINRGGKRSRLVIPIPMHELRPILTTVRQKYR